jgi:D-lactate dehydrogenase (cytochrome)
VSRHRLTSRAARGTERTVEVRHDRDAIAAYLEDAAHFPGGHASGIAFPRTEADVARLIREHARVLPIGAQSSLTGGATPMGELLISLARMNAVTATAPETVTVQAGVPIAVLQEAAAARGAFYPPSPTFTGATAGGVVATNAAGAATFKYGSTRGWVRALTIVLASGDVVDIRRGEGVAHPDGWFEIETPARVVRVPLPAYRMPAVPKCSAGYFAAPGMDPIDLFIGSEGTLGIVTGVTFDLVAPAPAVALALMPLPSEDDALRLARALRDTSLETRRLRDPLGVDVAAIEHLDRRCLEILREDGADRRCGVRLPEDAGMALLAEIELPHGLTGERAYEEIARALGPAATDSPLTRLTRLFASAGVLERVELALPGDRRRAEQLLALREAVPAGVNHRVGDAKRTIDDRIEKTAADMIVPFDRLGELLQIYRDGFERRGLDYAVWGHLSDGNLHPNVIPRSAADVAAGKEAMLEFGRAAIRLGGCPLAEHGVGRNPVKQALLRELYGEAGIAQMRAVKRALDPEGKLARNNIFIW